VPTLFFLLSGEHPTLPYSELKAVLEAEGFGYKALSTLPQIALINVSRRCIKPVASRCAMTRVCGIEIFSCNAKKDEIFKNVKEANLRGLIGTSQSFEVRVRRVQESSPELRVTMLEREIGEILLEKLPGVKVKLEKPDKTFFGILSGDKFVFGLRLVEIAAKPFMERRPRKRLFFHPTTMPPKLARCMTNLARVKKEQILLDPFCGVGGFLIEAGLVGCRVVGLDVKKRMVEGSIQNLRYFRVAPMGVVMGDARKLPFRRADCILTDPPYGRGATTLGVSMKKVISDFLRVAYDVLPKNGFICLASPRTLRVCELGRRRGFKTVERHFVYIHRSLTREIAVFRKV